MKFREQISQPGFVIDLMTAAMIISFPILVVILLIEVPPHVLYHRGPNWHNLMKFAFSYAGVYLVVTGARYLWKRRKSNRRSSTPVA
jgi:hypothetical protein